ncbi:MAG: GFA family protein [Rhizomicrobium sp.]
MIERIATCTCGKVRMKVSGDPIVSAICHCDSCQAGARLIEALPHAAQVRDEYGGCPYLTYRDDRFEIVQGSDLLNGIKLSDIAPTTRYVASCCNSGMYLKHRPGWWVSTYRYRYTGNLPPVTMRNQVKAGTTVPSEPPVKNGFPPGLIARLLAARVAMMFG